MTQDPNAAAGARTVTVAERAIAAGQAGDLDGNAVLWVLASADLWIAAEDEPEAGSLPNSPLAVAREGAAPALAVFTGSDLLEPWLEHRVRVRVPGFELLRRIPSGASVVVNPGHAIGLELPSQGVASIVATIERHAGAQSDPVTQQQTQDGANTMSTNGQELPGPLQQAQLIRQIAEAAGTEAKGDWSSVRLVTAMTAGVIGATNFVTVDGEEKETFPSATAVETAAKLRDLMYEPGKGTWFTMTMVVKREGTADTDFDYDSEPEFVSIPVDDQAFVDDARIFPRDEEHTPDWLRGKLEGRSAT